jgi:hypothetical protein
VDAYTPPPTRLYWHEGQGVARCDEVQVRLHKPPRVVGVQFAEIDCTPGQSTQLREAVGAAMRDMEGWEIACVEQWLANMAAAARDAVDGETTLVVVQR